MEKTLTIDGKQVKFKSTAATPLRYKAQFGRDFFTDIIKLHKLKKVKLKDDEGEPNYEAFELIDFDFFYNIVWALAKSGDNGIGDPITWLDGFEEFPLMEILPELQDLMAHSIKGKKN